MITVSADHSLSRLRRTLICLALFQFLWCIFDGRALRGEIIPAMGFCVQTLILCAGFFGAVKKCPKWLQVYEMSKIILFAAWAIRAILFVTMLGGYSDWF